MQGDRPATFLKHKNGICRARQSERAADSVKCVIGVCFPRVVDDDDGDASLSRQILKSRYGLIVQIVSGFHFGLDGPNLGQCVDNDQRGSPDGVALALSVPCGCVHQ